MRIAAPLCGFWLAIFLGTAHADDNPSAAEKAGFVKMCQTAACRKNVEFSLKKTDGTIFTYKVPLAPPVIQPGYITVYPGETLNFEAEQAAGKALDLHLVAAVTHPEKTLTLTFNQDPKMGDGLGMILKIANPFDKAVRYHLRLMPLEKEIVIPSSTCPIQAGLTSYESWPYPIFQILITSVSFMDPSDAGGCIE